MSGIIVRALFGADDTPTKGKVYRDVIDSDQWREWLDVPVLVVCFGEDNADFVRMRGYEPILAPPLPPPEYDNCQRSLSTDMDNRISGGFWWMKFQAVRLAMLAELGRREFHVPSVIWLDWDTQVLRPVTQDTFAELSHGPLFQGRVRQCNSIQCPWRRRQIRNLIHGGCYYFRTLRILEEIMRVHAALPKGTCEIATIKWADDHTDGSNTTEAIRAAGIDNPLLYTTHRDVLPQPDGVLPYFSEGVIVSLLRSLRLRQVMLDAALAGQSYGTPASAIRRRGK